MRARASAVSLLATLALLFSGCVGMPEDGSVRVTSEPASRDLDEGIPFDPRPPQRGEPPQDIVRHFLEAMMANPSQLTTARRFLTDAASDRWDPSRRMVLYSGVISPSGQSPVTVDLEDAQWLDARSSWRGDLPRAQRRLELPVALEDGEWRISEVPDAMIVHESWFRDRFVQRSLYFFDPSADILVPEPVFVPRGSQLPTALVRGLLQGPPPESAGGSTSFFPPRSALADVSVPVTDDGVAEVSIEGELSGTDAESLYLMSAQLAWTLRQDPQISAVRLTMGGTPVTLPGGTSEFPVTVGAPFDPEGEVRSAQVFGLRNGRLVELRGGDAAPVSGPFGRRARAVREVAVDPRLATAAAVTADGRSLLLGPVEGEGSGPARAVVTGASDLARPAWDEAGRLWVVDRTPRGAVVRVRVEDRLRAVRVPGISGEDVLDLIVSRDGTRLAAALDRPGGDVVVISRLVWDSRGVRATQARAVDRGDSRRLSIRDIGWRSPTELLVLTSLTSDLCEVRTVTVDGAPADRRGVSPAELLRADGRRLVSSPVTGLPAWVVTAEGDAVQLSPLVEADPLASGPTALGYAG